MWSISPRLRLAVAVPKEHWLRDPQEHWLPHWEWVQIAVQRGTLLHGYGNLSAGYCGIYVYYECPDFSPPARWGLLDFMSVACSSSSSPLLVSSPRLLSSCSLPDLNHDHPRPVFPAGPQPRPSPPSVSCRTSTTTIHAQCSLPDLNREYPRQVFPAGPHVECQKICQIECQIECQKICQIKCHEICQIDMPDRMSDRMPEDMPDRMPEDLPEFWEDMPDRMPEDLPDRMPEDMSDRMPEDMPDRMPDKMSEDMSEYTRRYAR